MSTRSSASTSLPPKRHAATWQSWVLLISIVTILPYYLSKLHYALPTPQSPYDDVGLPRPAEDLVLSHIKALEDIGYRTVGTPQARQGEVYVEQQVRILQNRCAEGDVLDCDVWVQTGDGFHEFTIMDHDVLKVYKGITNVILRIRAKTPPSGLRTVEKDALLLGSHIDSTLPAPGAADDGIGVGVMLDIARILVERNQPFDNSVIFLWNGGEETLQDGSHLYATQHETAKEVRAVINLEAAGTTGGALLFQATSKEMVEAFSKAPHPRGSVIAADVFSSGIMMSDTDFGQFQEYLNVSGLDMAIVGHSYFYHTQKDRLEFIETGSAQHFANNVMAIVDHLLSTDSPLASTGEWSPPDVVYLTLYDRVILSWSMETATIAYVTLAAVSVALAAIRLDLRAWRAMLIAIVGGPVGMIAGIISANLVAAIMVLLGRQQSWFKHEHLCLLLFVPPTYIGTFSAQLLLQRFVPSTERRLSEQTHYFAQLLLNLLYMLLLQTFGIRSAYIFGFISSVLVLGAIFGSKGRMEFASGYLLTSILYVILGVEALTTTLDIFTPLTGRMGKDAPVEFIIAVLSSSNALIFFPTVSPLFHRLSRSAQWRTLISLFIFTLGMIALFTNPRWKTYDSMHPKRVAVQYTYNHTTGSHVAHGAFMDKGPENDFLEAVNARYGSGSPVRATVMNVNNSDWDVLYPISSFIDTYRFDLPSAEPFDWPQMGIQVAEGDFRDGLRHLDLQLDFTGLVWPLLAFEAEIADWSFDFAPPKGRKRHHLKIATGVDTPKVDLSLTLRSEENSPLSIHWIGVDVNQMVPATAATFGPTMPGSRMLMDLHSWAQETYDDALEILLYAAVAGVVDV